MAYKNAIGINGNDYTSLRHKVNRRFTQEEDETLTKLVKLYGAGNWLFIASCMKTRNSRQCKDRWYQYLSPESNQSPWTEEEEKKLRELVQQYNGRWLEIGKFFEGRALSQIRNKWRTLERRRVVGKERRSKYSCTQPKTYIAGTQKHEEQTKPQIDKYEDPQIEQESVFDNFFDDDSTPDFFNEFDNDNQFIIF